MYFLVVKLNGTVGVLYVFQLEGYQPRRAEMQENLNNSRRGTCFFGVYFRIVLFLLNISLGENRFVYDNQIMISGSSKSKIWFLRQIVYIDVFHIITKKWSECF